MPKKITLEEWAEDLAANIETKGNWGHPLCKKLRELAVKGKTLDRLEKMLAEAPVGLIDVQDALNAVKYFKREARRGKGQVPGNAQSQNR